MTATRAVAIGWRKRGIVVVVLLAASLRVLYVLMATVEFPVRGDANQYVLYAWNLSHNGTFSAALPQASTATPDSYRGPGYPAFLAAAMLMAGHADLPIRPGPDGQSVLGYRSDTWMTLVFALQIVLGSAVAWLTVVLARSWLSEPWALTAGALVAVWPHLVSFTGMLLSETLFSFLLLASVTITCRVREEGSRRTAVLAGSAWSLTYLVNPVVLLFPWLAAVLLLRKPAARVPALLMLATALLAPAAWAVRNHSIGATGALDRMEQNLVQGSWPQYHVAFNSRFDNPISRSIIDAIGEETTTLHDSPREGLQTILGRMAEDPLYYTIWYVLRKPYLLWDWSIRIGWGDVYVMPTQHSPFQRIPLLRFLETVLQAANPLVFALALFGLVLGVSNRLGAAALLPAALIGYLSIVHITLQAEPRYSVPYRPEELLLCVSAAGWLANRGWRTRKDVQPESSGSTGSLDSP